MNDTKSKVTFVAPSILTGQVRPGYQMTLVLAGCTNGAPNRRFAIVFAQ